ncbi:hypothetical protein B0G74_0706 [Paraburkholderia sp. BL9I2N2]|nr:hypothetical protein B0G74_0706 [Paraburkholderia sp. BL9I2N2]
MVHLESVTSHIQRLRQGSHTSRFALRARRNGRSENKWVRGGSRRLRLGDAAKRPVGLRRHGNVFQRGKWLGRKKAASRARWGKKRQRLDEGSSSTERRRSAERRRAQNTVDLLNDLDGARSAAGSMTPLSQRGMCEKTDSRCTTTVAARGPRLQAGGVKPLSLLPFFAAAKKGSAAPHRGYANRPQRIQGKAKTQRTTAQTYNATASPFNKDSRNATPIRVASNASASVAPARAAEEEPVPPVPPQQTP